MESVKERLELFMKTANSKHGCQGNEAMWPQVDSLLPKPQLLCLLFFANSSDLFKLPFLVIDP